jgi:predicted CopG family antitoxin
MKKITVVVTDRLYEKLEYLRHYWGMDSWAKVLENLVKVTESLMGEDSR